MNNSDCQSQTTDNLSFSYSFAQLNPKKKRIEFHMSHKIQSQLSSQMKNLNTPPIDFNSTSSNNTMPSEPNLQPQQQQSQPEAKTEPQTIRPATFTTSGNSSSSSISTLSADIIQPLHQLLINNNNSTVTQPAPQSSSFQRRNNPQRFNRNQLNVYTDFNSTTSSASSISSSPKDFFTREPPRIHNKLICEEIASANNRAAKEVLSRLSTDELRSVKSHTELAETANGVRMLAKNLSRATIQLDVRAIMIITKARDNGLIYLTKEVVEWILDQHPHITIYADEKLAKSKRFNPESIIANYPNGCKKLKYWNKKLTTKNPEIFDLVLTLGGDGTVLFASNLFQKIVPPILSFSLGSLGFLTNFEFSAFRTVLSKCFDSGVKANLRMRFTCRVHTDEGKLICEQQVLNELVVDRGPSPYVTHLELYGDGSLLTVAQADGLIIATPTGSTAYSLSAGGSLVHPGVSAISVTPICPHTLSFRPILLPDGMFLKVKVPLSSRATAWCSFDGKVRTELKKGYYVTIQASPFPLPTVMSSKTEYIDSVSRNLHWNIREQQKPFSSYLKPETRQSIAESERLDNLHISSEQDESNHEEPEITEDFDINYTDNERDSSSSTPSEESNEECANTTT